MLAYILEGMGCQVDVGNGSQASDGQPVRIKMACVQLSCDLFEG